MYQLSNFYKKGLQISKRLFGINNVEVANFYNDTGYAFLLKKDFENSIKNFQKISHNKN